jgi:glucose/arabinose dehydrogenase
MEFLLSCISTKHSMLKKHWSDSKEQTECPLTVLGSRQKPKDDQGGLLCVVDESGQVRNSVELAMPAGMTYSDDGYKVASIYDIHTVNADLTSVQQETVSLPVFNMLHSLSRSRHGYLVASTGVDAILEFTSEGKLLWNWWAIEHGFDQTPTGEPRQLDKTIDHRGVKYGTLAQTTHVNSVAELPDGTVLATLFHQGMVIAIERETGNWQPVLDGLDHPHSVRIINEDYITVADTGRGRALLVKLKDKKGTIETEVQANTSWLQDSFYDYQHDRWLLVDGKNSRVVLRTGTAGEKDLGSVNLNPEWRLYEVLPL